LGTSSPSTRRRVATTRVAVTTPQTWDPRRRVRMAVPMAAAAVLTMLFPRRMVARRRSVRSARARTR
jgi:hypothetical protein